LFPFICRKSPRSGRKKSGVAPTRTILSVSGSITALALISGIAAAAAPRALLIGGGPNPQYNQAGIESNLRYVSRLLPASVRQMLFFADGSADHATVQYEASRANAPQETSGDRAFSLLFDDDATDDASLRYRKPQLPRIDAPTRRAAISAAFDRLSKERSGASQPLFLYFTGHGSRSDETDDALSEFDLWGDETPLSEKDLAKELRKIPASVPVTLVMAQCFSGGFGRLLFAGAEPNGPLTGRDLVGFFASTPDRVAAGCTPAVNEAEYKDFTSYFFAALTGKDRVGRSVAGADYNHDGKVGMDEAFAYSLIADESIDTPTATSDFFLRRFQPTPNSAVFSARYSDLLAWASPAQKAALASLSRQTGLEGENRLQAAFDEIRAEGSDLPARRDAMQRYRRAERSLRNPLIYQWPALRRPNSSGYAAARKAAIEWLEKPENANAVQTLFQADDTLSAVEDGPGYTLRETRVHRFAELGKSVVLAHRLMASGNRDLIAKWKRLQKSEARPFFSA
jgi:hypothetical protein